MRKEIDGILKNFVVADGTASAELIFSSTFTGFKGHFPEQPVLPGVCQMTLALVMADRMRGRRTQLAAVTNAKFLSVVVPDQPVEISCVLKEDKLTASLTSKGERVAQFKLRIQDA
jgi:3-hydroxyacyl-[acyl-carrier-protein] dehydratase